MCTSFVEECRLILGIQNMSHFLPLLVAYVTCNMPSFEDKNLTNDRECVAFLSKKTYILLCFIFNTANDK